VALRKNSYEVFSPQDVLRISKVIWVGGSDACRGANTGAAGERKFAAETPKGVDAIAELNNAKRENNNTQRLDRNPALRLPNLNFFTLVKILVRDILYLSLKKRFSPA